MGKRIYCFCHAKPLYIMSFSKPLPWDPLLNIVSNFSSLSSFCTIRYLNFDSKRYSWHNREVYGDQIAETLQIWTAYKPSWLPSAQMFNLMDVPTKTKTEAITRNLNYVNQTAKTVEIKERHKDDHYQFTPSLDSVTVKRNIMWKVVCWSMVSWHISEVNFIYQVAQELK